MQQSRKRSKQRNRNVMHSCIHFLSISHISRVTSTTFPTCVRKTCPKITFFRLYLEMSTTSSGPTRSLSMTPVTSTCWRTGFSSSSTEPWTWTNPISGFWLLILEALATSNHNLLTSTKRIIPLTAVRIRNSYLRRHLQHLLPKARRRLLLHHLIPSTKLVWFCFLIVRFVYLHWLTWPELSHLS